MQRHLAILAGLLASACLVQKPLPDLPAPTAKHETRSSQHPGGAPRYEIRLLVWSDGREQRDGFERQYHSSGHLLFERFHALDEPTGLWRAWYPDGTPRTEVDFGPPGDDELRPCRFWHPDGSPAAEGTTLAGLREGHWSFWGRNGRLTRTGSYRAGERHGPWVFFDREGGRKAEGAYEDGARVGVWTLWDAEGRAHRRSAEEVGPGGVDEQEGAASPGR